MTIQKLAFQEALQLVVQKEKILKEAIDGFFQGQPWDENTIEQHAVIDITQDGCETFSISGAPLIRFHPINWDYVVEGESVSISLEQPYEILFKPE